MATTRTLCTIQVTTTLLRATELSYLPLPPGTSSRVTHLSDKASSTLQTFARDSEEPHGVTDLDQCSPNVKFAEQ